jgi:cyclopropane fatty-acyl-phospholipid synthase-like methyltransferase
MTSDYYQTRYTYNKNRKEVWKAICQYITRYITPQSSVLDLGSGYCDFINNITAKSKIALDADISSMQYCDPSVSFLNIKATEMEFEENSFDAIFASNLFEHLNEHDLDELTKRKYKCLKYKGKLILIQPNYYYAYRNYWDDFKHVKAFRHVSFSDFLISKGFRNLKIKKKFSPIVLNLFSQNLIS